MPMTRCVICYQPVSMKPSRADDRVSTDDGLAHRTCAEPSPEEELLRDIFGPPGMNERRRVAADELGAVAGHAITMRRTPVLHWSCTCGMTGGRDLPPDGSQSRVRESGRQHLREAYVFS